MQPGCSDMVNDLTSLELLFLSPGQTRPTCVCLQPLLGTPAVNEMNARSTTKRLILFIVANNYLNNGSKECCDGLGGLKSWALRTSKLTESFLHYIEF